MLGDELPEGNSGIENTKEARLARLKKAQAERQLSDVFERFHPLQQESHFLGYYKPQEWEDFFQKLTEIVRTLTSLDAFKDNPEMKKECEEVLLLLENKDISQSKRYSDLVAKISKFFFDQKTFIQPKLP